MRTLSRAVGAFAATAGLVGLLAGCGSDGTPQRADAGSSDTSVVTESGASTSADKPTSTADASKVKDLVLSGSEFPAGYTAQTIPQSQTQAMLDTILESTRNAKVTPSHCMQTSAIPASVDIDDLGLAVGTKPTGATIAEALTVETSSIDEFRAQLSGKCAHLTMDMEVQGMKVKGTADQKIVKGPKVDADDSLVVEMTTVSRVGGRSITQNVVAGYASVNGYTVSVQAGAAPNGKPDRDAFDEVFTAAVAKVADGS